MKFRFWSNISLLGIILCLSGCQPTSSIVVPGIEVVADTGVTQQACGYDYNQSGIIEVQDLLHILTQWDQWEQPINQLIGLLQVFGQLCPPGTPSLTPSPVPRSSPSPTPRPTVSATPSPSPYAQILGKSLIFSLKVRQSSPVLNDWLYLGHTDIASGGHCSFSRFEFSGRDNKLPMTATKPHNPMGAPYQTRACDPSYIRLPSYSYQTEAATCTYNGQLLSVKTADSELIWKKTHATKPDFILESIQLSSLSAIDQPLGFAALSVSPRTQEPLTASYLSTYQGKLWQNNQVAGSSWKEYNPSLTFSVFKSESDPDVLHFSNDCQDGSNVWCQTSVLLNYAPYSKNLLYFNISHDFNRDGCFDESGHHYMLWAIREGARVSQLIFIESSYELDGYPIMSLGRYYLP